VERPHWSLHPLVSREPKRRPLSGCRDGSVLAFKGIRYAVRRGLPGRKWSHSPPSRQGPRIRPGLSPTRHGRATAIEDCLFLNVWTPETNPNARRAVMVYFHGGAYANGSVTDPLTQGGHLAQQGDVVVVTSTIASNALGYAWLQPLGVEFADSGNLGQLDLICALKWVRKYS
jgi:para-nitrobenzyl esterase